MLGAIFMVHWGPWRFAATESHPMGGMEALYVLFVGNATPGASPE